MTDPQTLGPQVASTLTVTDSRSWQPRPQSGTVERSRLQADAARTNSGRQLQRCCPRWQRMFERLAWRALVRLARNEPVDPNDPDIWEGPEQHAECVLRRHGLARVNPDRLTTEALRALIQRQHKMDMETGIDWSVIVDPDVLAARLRAAHARPPIDLDDPSIWAYALDQRRSLGRRLGVPQQQADDLSHWTLLHPDRFDPMQLRCWRIASTTWFELAGRQLGPVGEVQRPVAVFLTPAAAGQGWQLTPTLSLEALRLFAELGGEIDRDLTGARLPADRIGELVERINTATLHAGPRANRDNAGQLTYALTRVLGKPMGVGLPREPRDRWGRLLLERGLATHQGQGDWQTTLSVSVWTFGGRDFRARVLGASRNGHRQQQVSAAMDLGEAIQTAVDRGVPLLLSTEAAGALTDTIRVGRMKGRPGMLTITTSDGVSVSTREFACERAVGELRQLKAAGAKVTLDAGARQVLRMTLARPLQDDPVLLGRQRDVAALKVVGAGVDASQVGTGKSVTTGRALAQRAATQPRFRGVLIAEGRLLGQWRAELEHGAPGRGLPPLAPNVRLLTVTDRRSVAAQIRAFDRDVAGGAGVALVPNGILDRYPAEVAAIPWHLLVADEALRYTNPATGAHQALKQVRLTAAADCWLLTATPRGKSAEHLDVLVGLALGDEAMITDRLNTRHAGNLMDEMNAHRLRVNYGPHLVRVTRQDMQGWMPKVLPAQPIALDADSALSTLLEAIRDGGQRAYRKLLELLAELKTLAPSSPVYKQALAELSRVQGVVLGNVGVYVDASVDPETLTHSNAALAQALCREQVVQEAIRGGGDGLPLLRGITAQTLAGVAGEEQTLVFAERVWCLRQLAGTLRERHGIETHVADGSLSTEEFEALKARFVAGEFPVLCLSKIGHEGHNLQNASVLCHLDLPYLPGGLEQRVGRAARPGAQHDTVQTYIPYIKGAGVEHIVSVLSPRGAEHHAVLDSFEGVAAADSTIASQLGQITGQVATAKDQAGYAGTAAKLRVAASVFGN